MKRVSPVLQMNQTECGLCVATMLMEFYGVKVNLHDITSRFSVGRDGTSLADIRKIFNYYHFDSNLYEIDGGFYRLTNLALPCIAYHLRGHFIVIESIKNDDVTILDPAIGRLIISKEELENDYKNIILKITPSEHFEQVNTRGGEFSLLIQTIFANKLLVFRALLSAIFVYGIMLMVPMLLKLIVDDYLKLNRMSSTITNLSIIILLSTLVYFLVNRIKLRAGVNLAVQIDKYLSKKVISKLFRNKFEYFLNRSSSDIQYRLVLLKNLKNIISDVFIQAFLDIGSMIVILIYILKVQAVYALLLMLITILILAVSFLVRNRMLMYKNEELLSDTNLQVLQYDIFHSIFNVKVLGLSKQKHTAWNERYNQYIESHKKSQLFSAFYKNILDCTTLYLPIFIPLLGIWISGLSGSTEVGTIISLQSLTSVYVSGLVSVSHLSENITTAKSYLIRIEDVLNQEDEVINTGDVVSKGNINVNNLSFTYPGGSTEVLSNVSFSIKEGESVAIVGESGSGKSTLFYILLGAYDGYTGEINYEGENIKTLNKDRLRQQIGVVPQDPLLFNNSIKENLTQSLDIPEDDINDALRKVSMYDFIQSLPMKLNTVISENGFNFSGGQRQRLALARAIIGGKSVLFLDEATSSLDNITESSVVGYLAKISKTKITIAHRLSTIKDSDKIIVLKKGKVVEVGTHNRLIEQKGYYFDLYSRERRQG